MADIVGFRVTIGTADGTIVEDDLDWTSWSGGGESIRICPPIFVQCLPQTPTLDVFTLRGPPTSDRKALCDWINAAVENPGDPGPGRRNVRITERVSEGGAVQDGRSFTYYDCQIVEYGFPHLDASSSCGLIEEVHVKPIRVELK